LKVHNLLFLIATFAACHSSQAGNLQATIKDIDGRLLEDAVVTAMPLDPANLPKMKESNQVVDQVNKEFLPYVNAVLVNTEVLFPNNDNIRHHVYSFSPAKKFELPLYSGTSAPPVLFDKPGVVALGCNIHDWMLGYIYVSETPFFAKSGKDGQVKIPDIPAGEYSVRVWHPRLKNTEESTTRRIAIQSTGTMSVDWQLLLKPSFKLPRAAKGKNFGY
jgi:hypothetical protein